MEHAMRRHRLHRLLAHAIEPEAFEAIITPIFADWQHELCEASESTWKRGRAHVHLCLALARVWVSTGLRLWTIPVRRVLSVGILSAIGMALVVWTLSTPHDGLGPFLPFLLMAAVAPFVFRAEGAGRTFRAMFWSCAATGMLMLSVVIAYFLLGYGGTARSASAPFIGFSLLSAAVMAGSLIVAAASTAHAPDAASTVRRAGLALLVGTIAFVVTQRCMSSLRYGTLDVDFGMVISALFYFLVPMSVLHVPVVAVLGRRCERPGSIALLSGLLCPVTLIVLDALSNGEMGIDWFFGRYATGSVIVFVREAIPYLAGSIAIGWSLQRPAASVALEAAPAAD
jgi:hypothetical protein